MKRRNEVLVGILVLVALVIGILGTLWLARGGLSSGYPMYTRFNWGSGLKQGQQVLLSGVNIGYIREVTLDFTGSVVAEMHINNSAKVPEDAIASIEAEGIFGDMIIALKSAGHPDRYLEEGDTIPASPIQAAGLSQLIARGDAISTTALRISAALDSEIIGRGGAADLRGSLAASRALLRQLTTAVDSQAAHLSGLTRALTARVSAIDTIALDSTVRNAAAAGKSLSILSEDLRRTTARFDALIAGLDTGRGTMGKLLTDTSLYVQMKRTVAGYDSLGTDLRGLIADIKANPRKYVPGKFSVF